MRIEWNGKKLTKKRALFLCWKLWEWLAENPGKEKYSWPHWKVKRGKVERNKYHCPCCEFTGMRDEGDEECRARCPLRNYWEGTCLHGRNNVFYRWHCSSGARKQKDRTKYARRIAAAAKRRYEKL